MERGRRRGIWGRVVGLEKGLVGLSFLLLIAWSIRGMGLGWMNNTRNGFGHAIRFRLYVMTVYSILAMDVYLDFIDLFQLSVQRSMLIDTPDPNRSEQRHR